MNIYTFPTLRSGDDRFLKQFKSGDLKARFKPYSKFPMCYKVGLSDLAERATMYGLPCKTALKYHISRRHRKAVFPELVYLHFKMNGQDLAFWTSPEFSENNLCELVRSEWTLSV